MQHMKDCFRQGGISMLKVKPFVSISVLSFSVILASVLMAGAAFAQCTWVEGLSAVQLFNNVNDYNWMGTWNPRFDADWAAHYGGCAQSCSMRAKTASAASDPDPSTRPGVSNAIRNDTCPSVYDINCDCCTAGAGQCHIPGGCSSAPGIRCCGS